MVRSGSARILDNSLDKLMSADSYKSSYKTFNEEPEKKLSGPAPSLNFSQESLINGLIMAEVLGKPKCLRRGYR